MEGVITSTCGSPRWYSGWVSETRGLQGCDRKPVALELSRDLAGRGTAFSFRWEERWGDGLSPDATDQPAQLCAQTLWDGRRR